MSHKLVLKVIIVVFLFLLFFAFHDADFARKFNIKDVVPREFTKSTDCPSPLILQMPVDIDKVTGVLYPGQMRGGDFKPHGGFRFDNAKPDGILVRTPIDAFISDATRYIQNGEIQYMFDFETSCGIRYRFDHLLILSPKLAKIAKTLPEAKELDSRTTRVKDNIKVSQGEVIATAVGFRKSNNVFVDLGVYKNDFTRNPRESAICWFELLPTSISAHLKTLPAGIEGKTSEYCK